MKNIFQKYMKMKYGIEILPPTIERKQLFIDISLKLQISIDLEYIQHSYHTSIIF